MVIASNLYDVWILIANYWMQYPVGFVIRIGQIELTDFLAVIIQTLKIMLGVPLIFVPLIIAYQALAYNFFKGKAKEQALAYEEPY